MSPDVPSVREALVELLAALDQSADASEHSDDVAAMIRYAEAEKNARAALAAPPSEIPRRPTQAMLDAVGCATFDVSWDALTPIWQAMYDAAPKSAVSDHPPAKDGEVAAIFKRNAGERNAT